MDQPWWWVQAQKHPGCWIAVWKEDYGDVLVASPDPEVVHEAVPAGQVRFIFWQPEPCDPWVIIVGM